MMEGMKRRIEIRLVVLNKIDSLHVAEEGAKIRGKEEVVKDGIRMPFPYSSNIIEQWDLMDGNFYSERAAKSASWNEESHLVPRFGHATGYFNQKPHTPLHLKGYDGNRYPQRNKFYTTVPLKFPIGREWQGFSSYPPTIWTTIRRRLSSGFGE